MHLIIQEARIPHLPLFTDIDSFLGVDEYVVHLYDKYGEGGGMLSKKTFAQVTMYRVLYWDFTGTGSRTGMLASGFIFCFVFFVPGICCCCCCPRPWGEHLAALGG